MKFQLQPCNTWTVWVLWPPVLLQCHSAPRSPSFSPTILELKPLRLRFSKCYVCSTSLDSHDICMYIDTYIYTYRFIHMYIYICTHTYAPHTHICTGIHTSIYIYIYMYTCIQICMHPHTCVYICTHMHFSSHDTVVVAQTCAQIGCKHRTSKHVATAHTWLGCMPGQHSPYYHSLMAACGQKSLLKLL